MTSTIKHGAFPTQEKYKTVEGPSVQATESTLSPRIIFDAEESQDSDVQIQDMDETIKKSIHQDTQNVPSSSMVHNAAIDPAPSKTLEATSSSTPVADAYNSFKGMFDISEENMPYLEAGLKRHPQVLNWLNTKQQRVFASLFTEVTRILRTTRRRNLTEDDRNIIRQCCTALEVVGFDASWLNYVYGSTEKCGDAEDLKRRLEEAEAKASTLRNELASLEESLVLLHDEVRELDNFIES